MKKIEIRDWRVIDIYFKDEDEEQVNKLIKEYETKGYFFQQFDTSGNKDFDSVAQLMTNVKIKTKLLTNNKDGSKG